MHTHTITYTNFNNEVKTKQVNFNLTEAELTKLQKDYLSVGGINKVMDEAIASGDTKQLLDFFELLVHRSYGIKSADGEEFDKSPEIMAHFEFQAYYSNLYMSFFEDEGRVGQAFIRAVMPPELIAKAEANVRGEGDLHAAAEKAQAAQTLKPDARTIAQQARENLRDHLPKVQERNATIAQQTAEAPTQNIFDNAQPRTLVVEENDQLGNVSPPVSPEPQEFAHADPAQAPAPQPVAPSEWHPSTPTPTPTPSDFRVPAEAPVEEQPQVMTRAQWLEQQEAERLPRPPHEQTLNGL